MNKKLHLPMELFIAQKNVVEQGALRGETQVAGHLPRGDYIYPGDYNNEQ